MQVKGTGNYKFGMHGDSDAIFMRVFGTDNPFAELYQVSKDFFDPNYVEPVPCIVRVDIECSLEEFFAGGIKVVPVDIPVHAALSTDHSTHSCDAGRRHLRRNDYRVVWLDRRHRVVHVG